MSGRRRPTPDELALWRHATAGTAPLGGKSAPPARDQPPFEAPPALSVQTRQARALVRPYARALDPHRPIDLDRRSWLRLKRGQVVIEQTLDLHGQTQDEAHRRLQLFLADAQATGCRSVLVVTGKGLETGGTLRHMVPRWLNEEPNRARVLAFCPAQARHGGSGALYVLLRRLRTPR
jgi:DNA-nicking Smr family endonuclease